MQKLNNKAKQKFLNLFKNGYYLRPCVYDNVVIYEITKDMNPVNCSAYRTTYGEVNKTTANYLKNMFGFVVKGRTEYYGKAETVSNWHIRHLVA